MSTLKITSSSIRVFPQLVTRRPFSISTTNNSSILRKLGRKNSANTTTTTSSDPAPVPGTTTATSTKSTTGKVNTGSIASRLSKVRSSRFGASATTGGSGTDTAAADAMRLKFGGGKFDKATDRKNNSKNNNNRRNNQDNNKTNNSLQHHQSSSNKNNRNETPIAKGSAKGSAKTGPKSNETIKDESKEKTETQILQEEYKKKKQAEKEKFLRRELLK
ncbi:hypothetical protein NADFUDRAFT_83896, partial [Nadsonia fulvescens var. elongata DSM 6958]